MCRVLLVLPGCCFVYAPWFSLLSRSEPGPFPSPPPTLSDHYHPLLDDSRVSSLVVLWPLWPAVCSLPCNTNDLSRCTSDHTASRLLLGDSGSTQGKDQPLWVALAGWPRPYLISHHTPLPIPHWPPQCPAWDTVASVHVPFGWWDSLMPLSPLGSACRSSLCSSAVLRELSRPLPRLRVTQGCS